MQPNIAQEDFVTWLLNANGKFSIKSVWQGFRNPSPEVFWHRMTWFQQALPRWSIIQRLAILSCLATKYRMKSWGIIENSECPMFRV